MRDELSLIRLLTVSPLLRLLVILCAYSTTTWSYPQQFTFDLEDGYEQCFYAQLPPNKYSFMYQVIYGGQLDINVKVMGPNKEIITDSQRTSHDEIYFTVQQNATHTFCFNNAFSAMAHKRIYFELRPQNYDSLADDAGEPPHQSVLSRSEDILEEAHRTLSKAESLQIELKNRELGDRMVAEDLNTAVMLWSCAVTVVILVTTFGQVTVLKRFFVDKKVPYSHRMPNH